jgi:hypothetical protein
VVNLHRHDRQNVILLTGPILPALSSVMADDPYLAYGAWVIQCDTIQVMVMALFRGIRRPDPQYPAVTALGR